EISIDGDIPGSYLIHWTPTTGLSNTTISNPIAQPTTTTVYYIIVEDPAISCQYTDSVRVQVLTPPLMSGNDTIVCIGRDVVLQAPCDPQWEYTWTPSTFLSDTKSCVTTAKPYN